MDWGEFNQNAIVFGNVDVLSCVVCTGDTFNKRFIIQVSWWMCRVLTVLNLRISYNEPCPNKVIRVKSLLDLGIEYRLQLMTVDIHLKVSYQFLLREIVLKVELRTNKNFLTYQEFLM